MRPNFSITNFIDYKLLKSDSLLTLVLLSILLNTPLAFASTERVSVASDGSQAVGGISDQPTISADGRYIAFQSRAFNLVAGDTNNRFDVFVHDRNLSETTRASVLTNGSQAPFDSTFPSISPDGRYISFTGWNVSQVTNSQFDIFVHELDSGLTERVSIASDGTLANGGSGPSSISENGRYVAFSSFASNLVAGDTNGQQDIFIHDRNTGITTRASIASNGTQGNGRSGLSKPSISANGRYIAFPSAASNLVSGDTNGANDIFVHDKDNGVTTRVSVSSSGSQSNASSGSPVISADGRYVVYSSSASNLVPGDTNGEGDVFVYDRDTLTTTRISIATDGTQGNGSSAGHSISPDGRYIAFNSFASNLVPNDTNGLNDVFVHDRLTGKTIRINTKNDGTEADGNSYFASISADGSVVAFNSFATNLIANDSNGFGDIFVTDVPSTFVLSVSTNGSGNVNDDAGLINCGLDCVEGYLAGTNVTLTAIPDTGYIFTGWSGACSGTASCQLNIVSDSNVTANFDTDIDGDGIGDSTDTVLNINDGDVATLIDAINEANDEANNPGLDIIELAKNGTYTLTTIADTTVGNSGLPAITSPIKINGRGATISGGVDNKPCDGAGTEFRVFLVNGASAELTLNNTTVSGGCTFDVDGGGIRVDTGTLNLNNSAVMDNTGQPNGGIFNNGGTVSISK